MTDLTAAVLAIILRLPGPWEQPGHEEPAEERRARLTTIATAIGAESAEPPEGWRWSSRELAAALIATTYPESQRFHRDVHSGRRRGDRGKAACIGQVHAQPLVPRAEWRASMGTGLEATRVCIRATARVLGASARCVGPGRELDAAQVARIAAAYGTGKSCNPRLSFARARGRHWLELDRRLRELLKPERAAYALHRSTPAAARH